MRQIAVKVVIRAIMVGNTGVVLPKELIPQSQIHIVSDRF